MKRGSRLYVCIEQTGIEGIIQVARACLGNLVLKADPVLARGHFICPQISEVRVLLATPRANATKVTFQVGQS